MVNKRAMKHRNWDTLRNTVRVNNSKYRTYKAAFQSNFNVQTNAWSRRKLKAAFGIKLDAKFELPSNSKISWKLSSGQPGRKFVLAGQTRQLQIILATTNHVVTSELRNLNIIHHSNNTPKSDTIHK